MTRKGAGKPVDGSFADGRLRMARAYLKAARTEMAMIGPADVGNPAMSQIVHAAIAFTDALTASSVLEAVECRILALSEQA